MEISGDAHATAIYRDSNQESDSDYFTSLRLQIAVRPLPDLSFTARLNTFKVFASEMSDDDDLMVDRFFIDWNRLANLPLRVQAGRLPTHGENSPSQLRLGLDNPTGKFSPFTDLALDGVSLELTRSTGGWLAATTLYATGQTDVGYEGRENPLNLEDTEIYGLGATIYRNQTAAATILGLAFRNIYNIPAGVSFANPLEIAIWQLDTNFYNPSNPATDLLLERTNLGNIYHLVGQWHDQRGSLHYFLSGAWSRTDARGVDELGTSLLGSWWEEPTNKNGYAIYLGLRYDLENLPLQFGLEYNYGTKNWIAFGLGAEDLNNAAKLATRGSVYEIYSLYTLPPLPGLQRYTLRLGCQYFDYEYTGSGYWLGEPQKISDLQDDPLAAHFYNPKSHEVRGYGAVDLYF